MLNSEETINFDDVLSGENSEWEILDDEVAQFSKPPIKEEDEEEEETITNPPVEVADTTFEDEIGESSGEEGGEGDAGDSGDADDGEEDDTFDYLGDLLAEKGALIKGEGVKFSTEEDLVKGIEDTVTNKIEAWKNSLGEQSLKYVSFIENGGDPSKFIEMNAREDFSSGDVNDLEFAKSALKAFYKEKNFSDAKVEKLIESSVDMDEIEQDALEAQEYFKEKKAREEEDLISNKRLEAEDRVKAQEKFTTGLQSFITDTTEIRDFPLKSEAQKKEISDYIFKKNVPFKQPDGSIVNVSQYMNDKIERNSKEESKLEDIVFDALIMKYGSKPIGNKTLTDRNRKLAEKAKQHRNRGTSAKLSNSGGKATKGVPKGKHSFDDWDDF
jgi:hypothetical protein